MSHTDDQSLPHLVVFAAMRWECRPVLRALRQVRRDTLDGFTIWRGRSGAGPVLVMKTGIGPHLAQRAAEAVGAARNHGKGRLAFISTGCAGGLRASTLPGHVALATAAVDAREGTRFAADPHLAEGAAVDARRAGLQVHSGSVLCVDHALSTRADKRAAAAAGHIAVEMEGAAIAAVAATAGVPYLSVRTILDDADTELGGSAPFIDAQSGAVRPLALAKHLLAHPTAVADLRAMQRLMHASEDGLEKFFRTWLASDGAARRAVAQME